VILAFLRNGRLPPKTTRKDTHFFLSMSGMSLFSAFSTMTCVHGTNTHVSTRWQTGGKAISKMLTGILSGYLSRMRAASA